ncbi:Outer membrane protein NlpB, lipoprotein component of the protein assembly complex (forms a complex with YaeT, YfiO, and YfgL); Lipoprotein-34 precursor [uncultured Candidatus Thioglobus sp.]|nr:Outer membrane protein NlpB, lipoprotein component of the protein assembly complex (forms a complex with YaeT, YfiO, and YfgL); Lipoprotein-34 precursor [uncultured Candidatus Thioglobus sp.]
MEIPPDLTSEALEHPLAIPDEEQANTLSAFQKSKTLRQSQQAVVTTATNLSNIGGGSQFIVTGERFDVWSELREFWLDRDFVLDVDDLELGVLETEFKDIEIDGRVEKREKIKMFLDQLEDTSELLLVLESEQQENISDDNLEVVWSKSENSDAQAREWATSLNSYLHGSSEIEMVDDDPVASTSEPELLAKAKAEILNIGDKKYLLVPSDFFQAWHDIEKTLQAAGLYVVEKYEDKAIYSILYYPVESDSQEEENLLDKLTLWGKEEESIPLQISLTGVGNETEIIVLDEQGQWINNEDSNKILSNLEVHYNRLPN